MYSFEEHQQSISCWLSGFYCEAWKGLWWCGGEVSWRSLGPLVVCSEGEGQRRALLQYSRRSFTYLCFSVCFLENVLYSKTTLPLYPWLVVFKHRWMSIVMQWNISYGVISLLISISSLCVIFYFFNPCAVSSPMKTTRRWTRDCFAGGMVGNSLKLCARPFQLSTNKNFAFFYKCSYYCVLYLYSKALQERDRLYYSR